MKLIAALVLVTAIGVARSTPAISEFVIPTKDSSPWGITAGPDDTVWFTENHGNNIGRSTTAGTVTEFPIPTADSKPSAIVVGPDRALWFTEADGNKIGRIVPLAKI